MSKRAISKKLPDFKVDPVTGDAFISQRKLAALLGVKENTLTSHISGAHPAAFTAAGLSEKMVVLTSTFYAYESRVCTNQAKEFLQTLIFAGAKAYIYYQAGVTFQNEATFAALTDQSKELEAKVEELLDDNNKLRELREKAIANPRASLAMTTREERLVWIDRGWLVDYPHTEVKHTYHITEQGGRHLKRGKNKTIRLK